jgi:hypothetical protein
LNHHHQHLDLFAKYILGSPIFGKIYKSKKESLGDYLTRWFDHVSELPAAKLAVDLLTKAQDTKVMTRASEN